MISERAAIHEHFIDLCRLLGQPTPPRPTRPAPTTASKKHVKVVASASKGSKGDLGYGPVAEACGGEASTFKRNYQPSQHVLHLMRRCEQSIP